jgi:hypothetical protein
MKAAEAKKLILRIESSYAYKFSSTAYAVPFTATTLARPFRLRCDGDHKKSLFMAKMAPWSNGAVGVLRRGPLVTL